MSREEWVREVTSRAHSKVVAHVAKATMNELSVVRELNKTKKEAVYAECAS